jgi:hypothetical protein
MWNIEARTQTLAAVACLCLNCHRSVHWGFSEHLARLGRLDLARLEDHFMAVNACDRVDLLAARERAYREVRQRDQVEWRQDLGKYAHLVEPGRGIGAQL